MRLVNKVGDLSASNFISWADDAFHELVELVRFKKDRVVADADDAGVTNLQEKLETAKL